MIFAELNWCFASSCPFVHSVLPNLFATQLYFAL